MDSLKVKVKVIKVNQIEGPARFLSGFHVNLSFLKYLQAKTKSRSLEIVNIWK